MARAVNNLDVTQSIHSVCKARHPLQSNYPAQIKQRGLFFATVGEKVLRKTNSSGGERGGEQQRGRKIYGGVGGYSKEPELRLTHITVQKPKYIQ